MRLEGLMPRLHLIERVDKFQRVDAATSEWESGNWDMSLGTAERLIGGEVLFHKAQREPSYFGGRLTGCRVIPLGVADGGRVVLTFRFERTAKGVRTARAGWSQEMKIDWSV
jgi:hypothetical protein